MHKFLANLVTFGAVGRVEAAMAGFDAAKAQYDDVTIKLTDCENQLKKLIPSVAKDVQELSRHKGTLSQIMKDSEYRSRLSDFEKKIASDFSIVSSTSNITIPQFAGNTVFNPGSAIDDVSTILATLTLPIIGSFAANWSADEEIEKIEASTNEVLSAIAAKSKALVWASNEISMLAKQQAATRSLVAISESYEKRYGGIVGFFRKVSGK